jgi:hypothetical protein
MWSGLIRPERQSLACCAKASSRMAGRPTSSITGAMWGGAFGASEPHVSCRSPSVRVEPSSGCYRWRPIAFRVSCAAFWAGSRAPTQMTAWPWPWLCTRLSLAPAIRSSGGSGMDPRRMRQAADQLHRLSALSNNRMQLTSGDTCRRRAPMRRFAPPPPARVLIESPLAAEPEC